MVLSGVTDRSQAVQLPDSPVGRATERRVELHSVPHGLDDLTKQVGTLVERDLARYRAGFTNESRDGLIRGFSVGHDA